MARLYVRTPEASVGKGPLDKKQFKLSVDNGLKPNLDKLKSQVTGTDFKWALSYLEQKHNKPSGMKVISIGNDGHQQVNLGMTIVGEGEKQKEIRFGSFGVRVAR